MKTDRGSATVELVLLAPVLVVLALFVVYAGRGAEALTQVRHSADQGARAASLVRISRMETVGRAAVLADLQLSGMSCVNPQINVAVDNESAVRSVLVEVECVVNQTGLGLIGLRERVVTAQSIEVIDRWRAEP
jgi:Flp pilus assembly protein TadG